MRERLSNLRVASLCHEVPRARRVWPDVEVVSEALRAWAQLQGAQYPELQSVGYFGSYARGDSGFGSDLDVVIIDAAAAGDRLMRGLAWDLNALPVPVDVIVYTPSEWERVQRDERGFCQSMCREVRWVFER